MSWQNHIPNFKSISQKKTEKSPENRVDGHRVDWQTDGRTDRLTNRRTDRLTARKPIAPPPPFHRLGTNTISEWNTNAPGGNKVHIGYFKYAGQGHKVPDPGVIWNGFIFHYECQTLNMKPLSPSPTIQMYKWPKFKFFSTDRYTYTDRTKTKCPEFHFGGIKRPNLKTRKYQRVG